MYIIVKIKEFDTGTSFEFVIKIFPSLSFFPADCATLFYFPYYTRSILALGLIFLPSAKRLITTYGYFLWHPRAVLHDLRILLFRVRFLPHQVLRGSQGQGICLVLETSPTHGQDKGKR